MKLRCFAGVVSAACLGCACLASELRRDPPGGRDGGLWPDDCGVHTVEMTKAVSSDDNQTYNAGIFALVKDLPGFTVFVR